MDFWKGISRHRESVTMASIPQAATDESIDLQGRVLILRLELRGDEKTRGYHDGGRKWVVTCPRDNAEYLRATSPPDHITVTGAATSPKDAAVVRYLEKDLKLAGVKFDFGRDLVFLDGCANRIRERGCPGFPHLLRSLLGMFRRQLVEPAAFAAVATGLKAKVGPRGVGGLIPDYHDLFFPPHVGREIVLCINLDGRARMQQPWCTASLRRVERLGLHGVLPRRTFNQRKKTFGDLHELCVPKKTTESYELVGVVLVP